MFGRMIRRTFQGYAAPLVVKPEWQVPYLVFQAGIPRTRNNSLTGGGQMYGHEFQGTFTPIVVGNAPGVGSVVGGGQIVGLPPSLANLVGGRQGQGS